MFHTSAGRSQFPASGVCLTTKTTTFSPFSCSKVRQRRGRIYQSQVQLESADGVVLGHAVSLVTRSLLQIHLIDHSRNQITSLRQERRKSRRKSHLRCLLPIMIMYWQHARIDSLGKVAYYAYRVSRLEWLSNGTSAQQCWGSFQAHLVPLKRKTTRKNGAHYTKTHSGLFYNLIIVCPQR